jgi:predicted RNase H-like HicB family nuclease
MNLAIELEQETDGRWIAEIDELDGVLVYGETKDEAIRNVKTLALRVIADRLENEDL